VLNVSIGFNPRAREGRDLRGFARVLNVSIGFNPRAREGRDDSARGLAPWQCAVSIHAPGKGATCILQTSTPSSLSFNPRAREGRDQR